MPLFELRPFTFQQEILETIEAERKVHARKKHLIVAATGTGKTMLAAFDYRIWRADIAEHVAPREPRFLFVAHREEILKQALYTFRAVLRDQNFGDLLVGEHRPSQTNQLFISIQSFNSKDLARELKADYFDYIVVDEFHHSCAPTYVALLEHFSPQVLMGLTATPERADGLDVTQFFDGHITAEIRLPNAINRKLLCPFQYFGIADSVDYSQMKWRRGGYERRELSNVLTSDAIRAHRIAEKTIDTVLNIRRVRGLGFCASKAHAEFMTDVFCKKNIPAACLTADSPPAERKVIQKRLLSLEINFIFVVDLFNEGIDIPAIDTVLFLRPTESLTVFLQQLGRGLRLDEDKDCLTVLDFVGQAHRNFRYDVLFRALLTSDAESLEREIESNFPHLPSGCSITLERMSRKYILDNIRRSITAHRSGLVLRIAKFVEETDKPLTLVNFLEYHRLPLDEVYRRACWGRLCHQAGVLSDFSEPDEELFTKALRRLQHVDDILYIRRIMDWLANPMIMTGNADPMLERRLAMFYFAFFPSDCKGPGVEGLLQLIRSNPRLTSELIDLLEYRRSVVRHLPVEPNLDFDCPMQIHGQYLISEVRAALGHLRIERVVPFREGVLHLPVLPADVFFITLNKTDARYSPTTMYEDYAINETLFHWQSQSTTSVQSPTGQRYINHHKNGHSILLFVREKAIVRGRAMPFYFLGPAVYQSHQGERPISFVWKLVHPMPADIQMQTERLAVF